MAFQPEQIGDAAETVGESIGEIIQAPVRIIEGFFDSIFGD